MDRIDELGVEPASSVLHCPRSIMEFKQTRGQDGFCGRYQGSNASKRAKRLTMSLAPTLPTPYTPSYAHCPPFVLLYTQVHKDVTVSWYMLSNVSDSRLWLLKSNVVGWHKRCEQLSETTSMLFWTDSIECQPHVFTSWRVSHSSKFQHLNR